MPSGRGLILVIELALPKGRATKMFRQAILIVVFSSGFARATSLSVQCIKSVCGPDVKITEIVSPAQFLASQRVVETGLKVPVSKYMGRVIHESFVADKAFRKLLSMSEMPPLEPRFKALVNALIFSNSLPGLRASVVLNNDKYMIDSEKLKLENFGRYSDLERDAILSFNPLFDEFFRDYRYFNLSLPNTLPVILKLKYGAETSFNDGLSRLAREIADTNFYFGKSFPVLKERLSVDPAVKKALAGQRLSTAEERSLVLSYKDVLFLKLLTNENVLEKFERLPFNLETLQFRAQVSYGSSDLKKAFDNKKSIKGLYQQVLSKCMTDLSNSYALLPNKSQLAKFQVVSIFLCPQV